MYGWRGRIGLLVPSINTTMETEFWKIAPEGVSVHSARIAGGRHGTPEELRSMETASKKAAEEVAMVEPDVVVYGCTSGSFFEGPDWNKKIAEQLTAITKAPTVTTAGGMAACLMAGGYKKGKCFAVELLEPRGVEAERDAHRILVELARVVVGRATESIPVAKTIRSVRNRRRLRLLGRGERIVMPAHRLAHRRRQSPELQHGAAQFGVMRGDHRLDVRGRRATAA